MINAAVITQQSLPSGPSTLALSHLETRLKNDASVAIFSWDLLGVAGQIQEGVADEGGSYPGNVSRVLT